MPFLTFRTAYYLTTANSSIVRGMQMGSVSIPAQLETMLRRIADARKWEYQATVCKALEAGLELLSCAGKSGGSCTDSHFSTEEDFSNFRRILQKIELDQGVD